MKLVTTEVVATMPIVEIKGAIFSEQVISVNMVKDTISGFKKAATNWIVTQRNTYGKTKIK